MKSHSPIALAFLIPLAAHGVGMVDVSADLQALPAVPEGYTVSLFASEPLVRQPCSMAFDARGRLFVGMGPQYRNPAPDTPGDSVVIVTDENGDGIADKTHVFATGLNAIQGLAWRGRDLYIANAPDLTIVRDLDGDDRADEYVKLFTDLGNLEHGLHGLVFAPDGRLYMSKGNSKGLNDPAQPDRIAPAAFRELFGQSTRMPATPPRTFTAAEYKLTYQDPKDDWGVTGGILRCEADGSNLEIVCRGLRNPWDIAHDDAFHWLGTDNDQNEGDRVLMPFYGAHFGWNHPWSSSWTGENHLPTVPLSHEVFHGSGTGIVFGSLGGQRDVFFINDWLNKTTFVFKPTWDGALMKCSGGTWEPFIEGGKALFRPTDIAFGPDGALWCLSWGSGYGAEFEDGEMTNEGRIYRVAAKQGGVGKVVLPVHRIDEQDELVRRGDKSAVIARLERGKLSTADETWLMWTLHRLGERAWFVGQLGHAGNRRLQAMRILGEQKRITPLLPLTRDLDAKTRFEAVQALWRSGEASAVPALVEVAAMEQDRLTFYSAWQALRDLAGTEALKHLLGSAADGVRRAALLALLEDGALTAEEVRKLQDDPDSETRHLARSWLSIISGEGPLQMVKDKAITKFDMEPLAGEPPKLVPPAAPVTVEDVLAALPKADPKRGRLLALHPAGVACAACHRHAGRGNDFGPELTGIGKRADARHIIQSILEPSAVITEGFNLHVITTETGMASGVLLEESGLAVTLGLPSGQRSRIMRADIVAHETLPVSAMPPFSAVLDAQSCADIVAFLMQGGAPQVVKAETGRAATNKPEKRELVVAPLPETNPLRVLGHPKKGFCVEEHPAQLKLLHDGSEFAVYVSSHPQVRRPFMVHLRNREGARITRRFPPAGGESADHADMHPGLWLAFGGINGIDFWRNRGRVEVVRLEPAADGFRAESRWLGEQGEEVCRDITRVSLRMEHSQITMRWHTEIGSESHDLEFSGQEEAGLGVRMTAGLSVRDGSGRILSSGGLMNEKALWGRQAEWWRYGTDKAAIRLRPLPESSRPCWSHARDYGLLVLNPTGVPDAKKRPAGFTVRCGEVLRLVFDITLE